MNLSSVRALASGLAFNIHGVDATVTRPAPDNAPITTRAIWVDLRQTRTTEELRELSRLPRRDLDRRALVLPTADVPTAPVGTLVLVPDATGGAANAWRVDEIERRLPDQTRVIVVPAG